MNTIYDKTDKGREEIATRKYRLAPRLRTLLVLIDGKHDADDLLKKVEGLGLGLESLKELQDHAFIAAFETPSQALTQAPVPVTMQAADAESRSPAVNGITFPSDSPEAPAPISDATRFQNVYQFYNETIKSMIGLRGYGLQLKVEKAGTLDELRALRTPYLEAVQKAKGSEVARGMRDRLDQLLGNGHIEMGNTIFSGSLQE